MRELLNFRVIVPVLVAMVIFALVVSPMLKPKAVVEEVV